MDKEEIDWLLPEFHGLVIGKQGATIKEITAISGARIKIEKDGPCYIYGNIEQRDTAKALILEKITIILPKNALVVAEYLHYQLRQNGKRLHSSAQK